MENVKGLEPAPLYGLILVGGRSIRMGKDKSTLQYHGTVPQARFLADMLETRCEKVFYSCRPDQVADGQFGDKPHVPDSFLGWGPLGGILSALNAHPHAAFFVVACDLPFLKPEDLDLLLEMRAPSRLVTAFDNPVRQHPEPLCAIYEPQFREIATKLAEDGLRCPTKILKQLEVQLVSPESIEALDNANHPEDFQRARDLLAGQKSRDPL